MVMNNIHLLNANKTITTNINWCKVITQYQEREGSESCRGNICHNRHVIGTLLVESLRSFLDNYRGTMEANLLAGHVIGLRDQRICFPNF